MKKLNKAFIGRKLADGWRLGWKVTDDFKSYMYACINKDARVIYSIGDETLPKDGCGPLGIFTSLKHAVKFFNDGCAWSLVDGALRVHRCLYKPASSMLFFDGRVESEAVGFEDGAVGYADAVILLNTRMKK